MGITDIYTLSLHDALPILVVVKGRSVQLQRPLQQGGLETGLVGQDGFLPQRVELLRREPGNGAEVARLVALAERRSEEHTSELQSRFDLVCRLLLEKKNIR